jgi:hypothetical protein
MKKPRTLAEEAAALLERGVDTAPPERWRHGADPEMEGGLRQRVSRPVLALQRSGRIGQAEVTAADRFYTDYALGMCQARDPERSGGAGGQQGFSAAVIDAMTGYRQAVQALGLFRSAVLHDLVIEETSISTMAGADGGRVWTDTRNEVALILQALADHYATLGSRVA